MTNQNPFSVIPETEESASEKGAILAMQILDLLDEGAKYFTKDNLELISNAVSMQSQIKHLTKLVNSNSVNTQLLEGMRRPCPVCEARNQFSLLERIEKNASTDEVS